MLKVDLIIRMLSLMIALIVLIDLVELIGLAESRIYFIKAKFLITLMLLNLTDNIGELLTPVLYIFQSLLQGPVVALLINFTFQLIHTLL